MPKLQLISFEKKFYALALKDSKALSYREVAKSTGIPKSTIFDNLPKYRHQLQCFDHWLSDRKQTLVRLVLSMVISAKVSSRDCSYVVSRIFNMQISHQTVLRILNRAAEVAGNLNDRGPSLKNVKCGLFDEIFQKQNPILGFADPNTSLIRFEAATDRSADSWKTMLNNLKKLDFNPDMAVTDGAQACLKALKDVFPNATPCRDLFHLQQKLSKAKKRMEGCCYTLIANLDRLSLVSKSQKDYRVVKQKLDRAIDLFDEYETQSKLLQKALFFDLPPKQNYIGEERIGSLVTKCIEILVCFENEVQTHSKIKDAKTYLKNGLEAIVAYKVKIKDLIRSNFGELYVDVILTHICALAECLDQYHRSYENTQRKKVWGEKVAQIRSRFRLFFVNQDEVDQVINKVMRLMDCFKKSNSLIEAVNSVVRRYLVSYKSIPRWFCPLFTYYWNHKVRKRGKRAGFAPAELLTKRQLEKDWLDELVESYFKTQDSGHLQEIEDLSDLRAVS